MLDLLPRIALPCKDTRDGVVPDVVVAREITFLLLFTATREVVFVAFLETTLRDAVPVVAAVPRETVVLGRAVAVVVVPATVPLETVGVVAPRDTVARDVTVRAGVAALGVVVTVAAVVPRDTILVFVLDVAGRADERVLLVPARVACGVATAFCAIGAIGSANTALIDKNVEQTKNAPASKNTVPIASLQKSATLRLFINTLLCSGKVRKTRCLMT